MDPQTLQLYDDLASGLAEPVRTVLRLLPFVDCSVRHLVSITAESVHIRDGAFEIEPAFGREFRVDHPRGVELLREYLCSVRPQLGDDDTMVFPKIRGAMPTPSNISRQIAAISQALQVPVQAQLLRGSGLTSDGRATSSPSHRTACSPQGRDPRTDSDSACM